MTLFSIARKNIVKNFTHYFLYFASMIFSIVIYFTFVSLKYDTTIQAASESSTKISSVFSAAAVVLIVFVAIFIWYSNSFFTRKRKKEVGLYCLLGVRKKQIGRMLFYENFLMGVMALLIGLIFGSVLSRLFAALLMKVMGYDVIANFSIAPQAVIDTVIVFMLITLVTSFQGYRLIYRFKLIELFHADQMGEQEPKASWVTAVLSIFLIGTGYWLAMQDLLHSNVWKTLGYMVTPLLILLTVIVGTYLLFSTLTVVLLKMSKRNKKRYYSGVRIIGTSQLLYRMRGNARTLTIIAVLSATTLTAVGTAYSFYYSNRSNALEATPNSMMFISDSSSTTRKVDETIAKSKEHKLLYHVSVPVVEADAELTGLGEMYAGELQTFTILSNQDFNKLTKAQNRKETLELKADEAAVLDPYYMEGLSPEYVGSTLTLEQDKLQESITFKAMKTYSVLNQHTAYFTIVVSDELYAKLASEPRTFEIYGITNQDEAKLLTGEVYKLLPETSRFTSFYDAFAGGMETTGLMIFMGGFLGLVFLAATGSIIYFKQLTEANSDKGRYEILNKIGLNKKEIRKTISKQVLFIFALPLIAGIVHCSVALYALSNLLNMNLVVPVLICMGVYTFIYLLYYVITVNAYYKIVTQN
ncbi:FtsX-like permease family protein [Paenibacillus faecalis]|uniref:FtsX-like permease family protein n=1 Tax=Paenibacillus faecalis TaxID=2079532 RepID=UPI000D0FF945|nr:ABC transporter permease [Paenibacillus faecalis]